MQDISQAEKQALQERAQMRAVLRKEWQMKSSSPYRGMGGYIFDPAVQRYQAMRSTHWDQFKASPKTAAFGFAFALAPILFFWWRFEKDKSDREKLFRTGEVSYRDRSWKFI